VQSEARNLNLSDFQVGERVSGTYAAGPRELESLCARATLSPCWAAAPQVSALLWASYLIGMELPGRRALFSSLSMEFPPDVPACTPFEYQAEIERISDIGELTVGAQLSSGGHIWARATINAYVRQDVPPLSVEQVEKSVGRSEAMAGKVALVTGASRGLGACIVSALALHGCTILMNFVHSRSAAEQLRDSLAHSSGQLVLEQGDVADVRWCLELQHRIAARQKRLDFLICNASPALLPLWLEPTAAARVNQFLSTSLAMIAAPTAALMPLLAHSKGWNVLISSSAVTQIHPHFPHYAAAKSAAEALTRAAIAEYRTVSGLIVRPTRLLTDLTNTPMGRKDALRPECVGGAVVNRLLGPACPGKIEVLDEFSSG
jgi:NAD(P)-dependent dehydrogenase (short-subunit alcohol dehydrogenase family)